MPISWYDLVMAAFLIFALIRGAAKGIVWQLAAISAIVLCFYFAGTLSAELAPMLPVEGPAARWVAMFMLYVGFSFVSFGLARVVRNAIEKAKFQAFDRHLGAVFGLIKGVAFCLVVTFFSVTYSDEMHDIIAKSHSAYASAIIMDRLHPVMPEKMHDVLEPYIHSLDRPGMDLKYNHHADAGEVGHEDHEGHDHDHDADTLAEAPGEAVSRNDSFGGDSSESFMLDDANADESRNRLIEEIVGQFGGEPQAQVSRAEKIELALVGIPRPVALAVLRDWYADLVTGQTDPDPQTDKATKLDARIVRQLSAAKVPLTQLNQTLRDRLGRSVR
jgi:membrane protein required for colicin V production